MAVYGDLPGVQQLVPEWDGATNPPEAWVDAQLDAGGAIIHRKIATAGYVTPITPATVALYPELTGLENLYAGAYVLRSRSIDTASGEGEKDSELWLESFWSQLNDLVASNLTLLGAVALPSTTPRRRRVWSMQMRKVDGYSRGATGEEWEMYPIQGEYTGASAPSE